MAILDRFRSKPTVIIFEKQKAKQVKGYLAKELLKEKGKITTDSDNVLEAITRVGKDQKVMPNKQNFKLLKDIYLGVPVVSNAVNNTANFAIQSGFELEGAERDKDNVMDWIEEVNYNLTMIDIMKQAQIFGNSFLEFEGVKLLPVETLRVVASIANNNDGEVLGYKQILKDREDIEFDPDEVVHYTWNKLTNPFYGTSELTAVLGTLTRLLNFQEDIGEIIHRYGNPLYHWRLGTDESPATGTQISDFKSTLDNRNPGEDLITTSAVEGTVISSNLKIIQPDGILKHLENQLIAGLAVPEIFIRGGETSNKATADVELQAFDRRVKALRMMVSNITEDKIFPKITKGKVKISWHELNIQDESAKADIFEKLSRGGIPPELALRIAGWGSWVDDFQKFNGNNGVAKTKTNKNRGDDNDKGMDNE